MIDDATYATLRTEAGGVLTDYTDGAGRVSFPAPALLGTAAKPG
jgi:hypothetical protein